jgi:hypothetical protein
MTKSKYHTTQNLYEAAFLYAKGFKLTEKEDSGHKVTLFFEGDGVEDAASRYYNGGLINAKRYTDAYRTIKDYIFKR